MVKPIQRHLGAQGWVGRDIVSGPGVLVVPFRDVDADLVGQGGELAGERPDQVGLGSLLVRSGDLDVVIPPVL